MTDREPGDTQNQDTLERARSRFLHDFGDWIAIHPDDQRPAQDGSPAAEA